MKGPRSPPAIVGEIAIEGENFTRVQLVRHLNQAGIGKVCRCITILSHNSLDRPGYFVQFEWNFEQSGFDAGKNRFCRQ